MRVLFLCAQKFGEATYFRAYHLARQLSLKGNSVTLMFVSQDRMFKNRYVQEGKLRIVATANLLNNDHGSFDRLWMGAGMGPLDIWARIREGWSERYDIIHFFDHFPNIFIPFYALKMKRESKFVSDWCDLYHLPGGLRSTYGYRYDFIYDKVGFPFKLTYRQMEVLLRKQSDAVTVISTKLKEIGIEKGISESKMNILEGGVDTDLVATMNKYVCREKIGLPENATIIEFMGRCQNDLDIVMRSFALIKDRLPRPILLLVGKPHPSNRLKAKQYGISEFYVETGFVDDLLLPLFLGCADLFALPYRNNLANEARWANKFGEYLAAGRPTVISNVGDQAKLVDKHRLGLVAENTESDFADKISELVHNPEMRSEMGRNARRYAEDCLSWKIMAEKLEAIYEKLLCN